MSLPQLMNMTASHYRATYAQNTSGGQARHYTFVATLACNIQTETSTDNETFKQRREAETGTVYLTNATQYAAIGIADLLVINSVNYRVSGRNNACNLNRVFSITIAKDLSDVVLIP